MVISQDIHTVWQQRVYRAGIKLAGTVALVAFLVGIAPSYTQSIAGGRSNSSVSAQDFSDPILRNYARAVLEIEPLRRSALEEIQRVLGQRAVPSIACNQPGSIASLPPDAQTVAVGYCNESKQVVEEYGLTVSQFNEITLRAKRDPQLREQIQEYMLNVDY